MNSILLVVSWAVAPALAQDISATAPLTKSATSVVLTTGTLSPTSTGFQNGPVAPFNSPGAPMTQPLPPSPYNAPGAPFNPPPATAPAPVTAPATIPSAPPPRQGAKLKTRAPEVELALRALDEQNFESRKDLAALFDRRKKALTDSEEWIAACRQERKRKLKELKAEFRQLEERLLQRYRVIRSAIVRDGRDNRDKEMNYESRL